MAVNFGDTLMEGSIEPTVRVQAPVEDNSGAVLAQALAPAARNIGAIAGSIFAQGQADANAKILTDYENELLNLADAVDQGLSRNEAMIKARNLRRQYLANAPALQDDFDTIWSDFAGANGLGHVVISGTAEEQAMNKQREQAYALGYTPEEFALFQSRTRQATELNYQLTQTKNSGELITETQRLQGLQAVVGVAQSAYPSAQRQINEAMAKIQANPNDKQAIAAQLNNVLGNSIAQLKFVGGSADSDYIVAPIEQAMATFNAWVNGEVENSVMEGTLKATELKYDLMYATDPTLGPVVAASKIFSSIGIENTNLWGQLFTPEVVQKFGEMSNPSRTVNLTDGTDASARTSEAIKQAAGMVNDNSDPELIDEINQAINQAVDSAYVHERSADGALGFKDIVELLGSNEVGAFLSSHGSINAQHAPQLVNILKNNYETELLPVINRAWVETVPIVDPSRISTGDPNATAGGINHIPMNQLLEPRWNGNAVEFVPTEAYANNPRVIQLATDVTSGDNSIGIPLNNLINAYANVTGVDGKQIYEQDFAGRLFGIGDEQGGESEEAVLTQLDVQPPTSLTIETEQDLINTPDAHDLTLEDFNPDELEEIVVQTQAAEPQAVLNATSPVAFAQAFIGLREDKAEDQRVLSSFIKQAAGISINPAQTAWCAAFVDAVLNASGQGRGTGKLNARSYLNWGRPVTEPQEGDVVVLSRGDPNGWQGHVGFYAGMTSDGKIRLLGGNQGNSVSISTFDANRVLGYRRAS